MISLTEARDLIAKKIPALPPVVTSLAGANHRVLRQNLAAPEDIPAFDRSAMDGYAIGAEDDAKQFQIVGEIQPGAVPKWKIRRGECARIFTGSPVPAGASLVLMQEDVRVAGNLMVPLKRSRESYIRERGEDARKGDILLRTGTRLGPGELALLASLGITRFKTTPAVRVVHFATGNELVAPGAKPRPGQIRDCNSTLVAALVERFGGQLIKQERVKDDFKLLVKKAGALKKSFDVLLLSGGASVGDYDFGRHLLVKLGFKLHFTAINLRPGKPLVFATRGKQAAFILPGNPVSHLVTLHVAVRLAFERLLGTGTCWPLARIKLSEPLDLPPGKRETFWPARVEVQQGGLVARALRWQSSGDVTGLPGVNALLQLPAGTAGPGAGGDVSVLMLEVP